MSGRIFSLEEAQALLPQVRALTADAVRRADALVVQLQELAGNQPEHARLARALDEVVRAWAEAISALDVEVKGLWLVDFNNGSGYYCWRYPEEAIRHFHGYDEGFAGRMKIV